MVSVLTCDSAQFDIGERVITGCLTLKNLVDDIGDDEIIPLPSVHSNEMKEVISFYTGHQEMGGITTDEAMLTTDAERLSLLPTRSVIRLMEAADYLCAETLLNACAKSIATSISKKTTQEIRDILGIENDFTPEEEAEIQRENAWAFAV